MTILRQIVVIFLFSLVLGYNGFSFADEPEPADNPESNEGQKIQLEKAQIIGAVERPGTFYNIPWQSPEIRDQGNLEFNRNFRKEIFDFIDQDELLRRHP